MNLPVIDDFQIMYMIKEISYMLQYPTLHYAFKYLTEFLILYRSLLYLF